MLVEVTILAERIFTRKGKRKRRDVVRIRARSLGRDEISHLVHRNNEDRPA